MKRPRASKLVWADEFGGDVLDLSKWSHDGARNKAGWYNGELQYYGTGPRNLRVGGGVLTIEARRETLDGAKVADYGGQGFTAAKVRTKGKGAWTYGYYEIRAKLPCGRGSWPAIWMMPEADHRWPDGGEIDIMEHVGSEPEVIHGTLHTRFFVHRKGTQRGAEHRVRGACARFHTYQLDWTPQTIRIGADGRAFMQVLNDAPGGEGAWPFDHPFHLILNLAVGGHWAGAKGIDEAAFPQRMVVDYVRVYQVPAVAGRGAGG